MPHYQLVIRLQHTDRRGQSLDIPTAITELEWSNDKLTMSASIERAQSNGVLINNDLSVREVVGIGISLDDLLFYNEKEGLICWREQDDKGAPVFIQHNVLETPFNHISTSRFRLETADHLLWCYQAKQVVLQIIERD